MTETSVARPRVAVPADLGKLAAPVAPTSKPFKIWVWIGVASFAIQGYAVGSWILSDDFQRVPQGPTPLPHWMWLTLHIFQVLAIPVGMACLYVFVFRPLRRQGRLSFDGLLCLVFFVSLWWQDSVMNWFQPIFTYNSTMWNRGTWNLHIPGFVWPNANKMAEPLTVTLTCYMWLLMVWVLAACFVMRKAKERWPHFGPFKLIMIAWAVSIPWDIAMEYTLLRMGWYAYPGPGAVKWFTLFSGHHYQFPLMEAVLLPALITTWAALRFFRNDKGESIVERGLDQVRVSPRRKTMLRYLAICGFCNLAYLLVYNVPWAFFSVYAPSKPVADIQNRSYFVSGICGPTSGTDYACPTSHLPMPVRGSGHVDPDGTFVPAGTKSPGPVR